MSINESPTKKAKRRLPEEFVTNRLHPINIGYTAPIGTRVDMDRILPLDLTEEDPDEWLDALSSPPEYEHRISPVSCTLNQETLSGVNPGDLEVHFYRKLTINLGKVAQEIDIASRATFGEKGPVAFMGLCLDPDTSARIIEADYDTADNVYTRMMELVEKGFVTPVAVTPFNSLLTQYQHDFELRFVIRVALEYYWPLLKKYNRAVMRNVGEKYFMVPFMFPEGGFNGRVLQVLHAELMKRCEAESITPAHLIILLDTEQSKEREQDVLMKRWNTLRPAPTTRDIVTVLFKERSFTDWVIQGHPSTKKQLDRTIAKVDAVLRDQGVDHAWTHAEPLRTLISTFKSCLNFEQKILKLTELKYQPCGPDLFVRRKLLKLYGMEENEPRRTTLRDNSCWHSYPDMPGSLSRYLGCEEESAGFTTKRTLAVPRPYQQVMADGTRVQRDGNPIWKVAFVTAMQRVYRAIMGEPKTFIGGMLGLIREEVPIKRVPIVMRNVEDFLVQMARVTWKEHFIHHVCSEADIQLAEICRSQLLKDAPAEEDEPDLTDDQCITIGAAAHAIYQANMALNASAVAFENIDNRAVYEAVALMTLACAHAISAFKWLEQGDKADEIFSIFKRELLDFESAFEHQNLAKEFGVTKQEWADAIRSEVPTESDLNIVTRAARRVGAKHLRLLGYRKDFDRKDEGISTSCGHIWSYDIDHLNLKWENEAFCGLREE